MAGQLPILPSKPNAVRESPTRFPYRNQKMTNKHALALFGCCENQQCVNVFYDSIYIGLFYVKDIQCKRYTKTDAIDEVRRLQNLLQELSKLMPKRFKKDVTDDMKRELSGILPMSICVRLV